MGSVLGTVVSAILYRTVAAQVQLVVKEGRRGIESVAEGLGGEQLAAVTEAGEHGGTVAAGT